MNDWKPGMDSNNDLGRLRELAEWAKKIGPGQAWAVSEHEFRRLFPGHRNHPMTHLALAVNGNRPDPDQTPDEQILSWAKQNGLQATRDPMTLHYTLFRPQARTGEENVG